MEKEAINNYYSTYVKVDSTSEQHFLGHFDFLVWANLLENKDACTMLQRKPFYKISLLDGHAFYGAKGQDIPISGHTIVFSSPLSRFSFTTTDEDFDGKYCICSERFLRGSSRLYVNNWPVFKDKGIYSKSLTDAQYNDILGIFNEIEKEHKSDYPLKEELVRNRFFDIIHYVQKLDRDILEIDYAPEDSLESRFFKLLENTFIDISPERPLEGKSPAYYADLLFVSVHQLNKIIKKDTGKTTQELIHARILAEADVLLKHSGLSVKEIAYSLNFKEAAHFQNFYKKRTGHTPAAYRGE